MNNKGIILFVSMVVMSVVLLLTGVYFSSTLTDKRSADAQGYLMQALSLAEAGANHAQSELRIRITGLLDMGGNPLGLKGRVNNVTQASVFVPYTVNPQAALNFVRDYAYGTGQAQFSVPADPGTGELETSVTVIPLAFNSAVQGSYTAKIIIKADGNPTNVNSVFTFPYKYTIESTGTVTRTTPNINRRIKLLFGKFTLTVRKANFAKYALFTNHHMTTSGTTVWFTANTNFNGPMHTNERFSFANNPSGIFTDEVVQHYPTARFYNNGSPRLLNDDHNGTRDVPVFNAGFQRGADTVVLPTSVTQSDMKKQATGNQNDSGWSNGIYLPNSGGSLIGGIYIKGDASNLTMSTDGSNRPVYTITRGTNTKTITVDYTNNQTIVANTAGSGGTAPGTYSGIPDGIGNEGTIIYSSGSISNFSGTVQRDSKVTVSSNSDISINNHIRYQDYTAGPPPSAIGTDNLLGIITWNGDARISTSAPNNLNIHGIVMAPGDDGVFRVDNYNGGSPRGTVTLLGGSITDCYGAFGTFSGENPLTGYGRNFVYDERMLTGSAPPFFPYTTNYDANVSDADGDGNNDLSSKLAWQDQGV